MTTTLHVTRYRAGAHIAGEVKGPTTYGRLVIATGAEYDAAADKTRVTFSHLEERKDGAA